MYAYAEFPRVVYGPNDESQTIESEDARPDGWKNHPNDFLYDAKTDKVAAGADAKAAEKALRDGYKDFLDRHNVSYAKNLGTDKLGDLVQQLEDHLTTPQADDGDDDSE